MFNLKADEKGIVRMNEIEFINKFGEIEKLEPSKRFEKAVILSEEVYSHTSGNWGGVNSIIMYGISKPGGFEIFFACHNGNGYAREEEEIRMDNDCEHLNKTIRFIELTEDAELAKKIRRRIEDKLRKTASIGHLVMMAKELDVKIN